MNSYLYLLIAYLFLSLAANYLIFKLDETRYEREFKKDYLIFIMNAIFVYPLASVTILTWTVFTSFCEVVADRVKSICKR